MTKVKLLMVGVVLIACSTKSASDFSTSEMVADMSAVATGNGSTTVSATLREEGTLLTFIQLTADDELIASSGSETKAMDETSLLGLVSYNASFNKDVEGAVFNVKLTRTLDGGAPNSSATLPKPFSLNPLDEGEYSRAEPISVSWATAASSDTMTLQVTGECIDTVTGDLASNATGYVVEANAIRKRTPSSSEEDDQVPDTCDATITVTRRRPGSVDPAFHSGSFVASQVRSVRFVTKP